MRLTWKDALNLDLLMYFNMEFQFMHIYETI